MLIIFAFHYAQKPSKWYLLSNHKKPQTFPVPSQDVQTKQEKTTRTKTTARKHQTIDHPEKILSEMDALKGIGHACGHNLIAVSGCGVALAVKAALQKHNISGKVILLGTPGLPLFTCILSTY